MNSQIINILQLIDKLRATGKIINIAHVSALSLCSIPNSYNNLLTTLKARPKNRRNPISMKTMLVDECNRCEGEREFTETAKACKTRDNSEIFCHYCWKKSLNINECWTLKNKNLNLQKTLINWHWSEIFKKKFITKKTDTKITFRDQAFMLKLANQEKYRWTLRLI